MTIGFLASVTEGMLPTCGDMGSKWRGQFGKRVVEGKLCGISEVQNFCYFGAFQVQS